MSPVLKGFLFVLGNIFLLTMEVSKQRRLEQAYEDNVKDIIEVMSKHDDPKEWFDDILDGKGRQQWAGRYWYKARMRINGIDCDMICPTSAGLTLREEDSRSVAQLRWDTVNDVVFFV